MINYNFILEKAKRDKIDKITILREYWQLLFLQKLYQQKESANVYFKGGTAIRFLFNSFRFSEDLDFTVELVEKKAMALIKSSFDILKKEVSEEIILKKERVIPDSLRFRLIFHHQLAKQSNSFRIDFSKKEKPQTRKEKILTPFDYPISPYPLIIYLSIEEILAEKMRALLIRGKARDVFDVWFLLTKEVSFNQKMMNKKMKIYPQKKFSLEKIVAKIESFKEKDLKQDLNQFLPENYREFYKQLPKLTIELLKKKF